MNHLWQGEWIDDFEFSMRLSTLSQVTAAALTKPLSLEILLTAAAQLSLRLRSDQELRQRWSEELTRSGEILFGDDVGALFQELSEFLQRDRLSEKIRRELGSDSPFEMRRIRYDRSIFESWAPLGLLVHVAPGNVFTVAALSAVEGLLTGNLNFVKVSGQASRFTHFFFEELLRADPTGELKKFVIVARFSSGQTEWLRSILSQADGVAAWGGEEALQSLRRLTPATARLIAWGHRLSMIYVSRSQLKDAAALSEAAIQAMAREVCLLDQQACSSPQAIYLDSSDPEVLSRFARQLAAQLKTISPQIPRREPGMAEASEITVVTEKHRLNAALGEGELLVSEDGQWRVLLDHRPELIPSPLFRTIWVKPLPSPRIAEVLRPLRGYLQTVGLQSEISEVPALTRTFLAAGALRLRPVGQMIDSYEGEPHDGEYALSRYVRRISFEGDGRFAGLSSFSQIEAPTSAASPDAPILGKAHFQNQKVADAASHLFFKSGGSSGEPKISIFTYADYHRQMRCAAEGLYAAGLDPIHDRCMNLFFGGGLYGGFISFFTVLEHLGAKQFPMAAHFEWDFVIDTIIKHRVNVLLGMPSYLLQLFEKGGERLAKAKVVQKVFYGGEHFTLEQRKRLQRDFGVDLIKSATYGSVDAGPLAYQCQYCEGSVHHVHNELQTLEIVGLEKDAPVAPGEVGRLIFSSKVREGQNLQRYDIGDVGRWVTDSCLCGRQGPRVELMGRHGDVVRVGGTYLNSRKWEKALGENLHYGGEMQIEIRPAGAQTHLELRLHKDSGLTPAEVRSALLQEDADLREVVDLEKVVLFSVNFVAAEGFQRTPGSGKLIRVLDRRMS